MKINKIELCNFMGIAGRLSLDIPHISALIGPNGMGKTTIITAIRYCLTGEEPDGDIIHKDYEASEANIVLTDPTDDQEYEFTRIKYRGKPSKCKINGKSTTQKSMNEKIESIIGIPLEKVKILASSDIVSAMKPQEFSSFILDYIPEKLSVEDVITLIPDTTMGMLDILEANLPADNIDFDTLNEFDSLCRYNRKELKDVIARKNALIGTKPAEDPGYDKAELEEDLKNLSNVDAAYKVYETKLKAYTQAKDNADKHEQMLKSLQKEIEDIKATRPDVEYYKGLLVEEKQIQETINNHNIALSSAKTALSQLEISLKNLESPVCPLSDKIICTQDKTAAKEDLSESIHATNEGINALQEELKKAQVKLDTITKNKAEYQQNYTAYEKKIALSRQYKALADNKPEVPEKPDDMEKPDVAAKKAEIEIKLKTLAEYNEGLDLKRQLEGLNTNLADYEALVKAMAEKGPVRSGVAGKFISVFEELCNERSAKVRPEITFKFVIDDGVVVLMNNGKGAFLPYASLSGGEQAYMIFILMDMLNSLCGSNILLLDELSVVDIKCFDALLDIIMAYETDYDHILIAAVDHVDTVESVSEHKIPFMELKREVVETA